MFQVTGFTDMAPVVREQTVKAVLTIISKLSDRTINGELLKYLAKTQNDDQAYVPTRQYVLARYREISASVRDRRSLLQHLHALYEILLFMPGMQP